MFFFNFDKYSLYCRHILTISYVFFTLINNDSILGIFLLHTFLVKLRYSNVGSKIFHCKEKYDGLLLVIWRKNSKKVEAYFTIIWKNANHLYNGIHDKNHEFLNIHYYKKIFHMRKKCVDIISHFWRFFVKKVEKKTPLFDKKMACIIV